MSLFAISEDDPADSLVFARNYDIAFPLLADDNGATANAYTGTSSDQAALPGVVIVGRDGRVVFRQIGESKADRLSAAQILAALDASLGTTGEGVAETGYAPLERAQLRLSAGGGAVHDEGGTRGTAVGQLDVLFPLGRYVLVGPSLGSEPRIAPLDVNGTALLRAPIWNDLGALELGVSGGWSPWSDTAWNLGGRTAISFAWTPSFAVQLGASVTAHGSDEQTFVLTFGVARLFQLR